MGISLESKKERKKGIFIAPWYNDKKEKKEKKEMKEMKETKEIKEMKEKKWKKRKEKEYFNYGSIRKISNWFRN